MREEDKVDLYLVCEYAKYSKIDVHTHTHTYVHIHTHKHTHTHLRGELGLIRKLALTKVPNFDKAVVVPHGGKEPPVCENKLIRR